MTHLFHNLRFYILMLSFSMLMAACGTTIEGTVARGDRPFTGVTVRLTPSDQTTQTDSSGHFSFQNVDSGHYTIVVNFETETQDCKMTGSVIVDDSGNEATVDFLMPENFTLQVLPPLNDMGMFSDKTVVCRSQ